MDYRNNKLKELDKTKILARYNLKLKEYEPLSLDELKDLFNSKKMSSTDRQAIVNLTNKKINQLKVEEFKKLNNDKSIEGE